MIRVGDKIPSGTLRKMTETGPVEVNTDELFKGRKVVLFAVPGAFTPPCSKSHLPGYVQKADEIRGKGIDEIVCLAPNDVFVAHAWGEAHQVSDKVTMLADGSVEFTRALGLELDLTAKGMGMRSKRYSMVVEDGVVKKLEVEPNSGEVAVSGAATCTAGI